MDSKEYKRVMKKVKALQRKMNSDEQGQVIGNGITTPFRAVGWIMKQTVRLVIAIIVLAIIASVIQYAATGHTTLLEFLKGF